MDLNEYAVFTQVVQSGSFTAAARELDMPKSTVSRKVADLEERLGARLLQRTTRRLNLTEVGETFFRHALRVMSEVEEAELAVTAMQDVPRGLLRVTAPLSFGFLGPIVASFLERRPQVEVELVCTDRVVDLVQEGFDVGVRAGRLSDSTLVSRGLGTLQSFLVASPAFRKKHGVPKAPEELERFDTLVFGSSADRTHLRLVSAGESVAVRVKPRLVVNDFEFLESSARAGLGIAWLPVFRITSDLHAKRLVRVLPEWSSPEIPIQAVYPSSRFLSPKVKAFLDHLREQMTPPPWERV